MRNKEISDLDLSCIPKISCYMHYVQILFKNPKFETFLVLSISG